MFNKLASAAFAAALALATLAPSAHAQKALVYCPVGLDAAGCDRVVAALQSKFPDGVDRGYDGSAGTVDLSKADLNHYGVVVVPSLADNADKKPYAVLRSAAARLRFAINGRVAVYSGAPDQGNANREDKDALIQNLAGWAAKGHARGTSLVGLVAFLDLSENEADRYAWVKDISLVDVSADAELRAFPEVSTVSPRGGKLLARGGKALRFSNMASYGLHIGRGAASRTEVGATGGASGAQSVLVTYANADGSDLDDSGSSTGKVGSSGASFSISSSTSASLSTSASTTGATLTTNKPDYQPGDTVTFTGAGFAPGDTVTITVHEDPTWSYPDRQFKSVADASGAFTNRQMVVDQQDLDATFTATAVGNPSGTVAQTTFTDAGSLTLSPASGLPGTSVSVTTGGGEFTGGATNIGIYWDGAINTTTGTLQATCSVNGGGNVNGACSFAVPAGAVVGPHTVVATEKTNTGKSVSATFTVTAPACTPASIATNPVSTTKNALQAASFSVSASGTSLTYKWQVSSDNGANFTDLSDGGIVTGATTATLNLSSVSGTDNGKQYRAIVTASCGAAATSTAATLTVNKLSQSAVTVTAPSSVTFGLTGTAAATGGDGTGAYSFNAGASSGCSVVGTTVSVSNASGTCALTATRAGDDNYNASSPSAAFTVTLNKATQMELSLTVPASVTYGATGTATTTGGSGTGALTFSATGSTGCAVDTSTGVISVSNASGTCSISASKAGDNNYNGPVTDGPKSVTLNKANQSTVTVTAPSSVTFGTTGTAAATGGDGAGTYTFSAGASTGCSVSGTTVSVSNASGTCSLTATRAGDNNYNVSAASAGFPVTLIKADQSAVTVTAPASVTYGATGTALATGGDGTGGYTFDAGVSTGCSVTGTTVSVSNASGTCALTVTRAADNNYNISAPSASFPVTLNKANQTTPVLVTAPSSVTFGTTGTALASGGDGTGPYSFSAGTSAGCSVTGTTVSVIDASAGCALTATRGGDNNYNASAPSASFTVTLNKATQAPLMLTVPTDITFGATGTATTAGGSGTGALTFSAAGSTGCAVNTATGVISVSDASGTCSISASKAGDNNYNGPVSDGPKIVTLKKATQTALSLTVPASVTFGTTGTATTLGGSGTGMLTFSAIGSTGCAVNPSTGVISVSDASGTCSISASKEGDNNYNGPVSDGPKSVMLVKANQGAVSVTAPGSVTFGTTGTAAASGGNGTGLYSFSAGASTGCSVSGTTVSVSNASGSCALTATRAGDNNYNPSAPSASFTVMLNKANQSAVGVTAPGTVTFGTTGTAAASGGDGTGGYTFSAGASTGCSVSGTTVSVSNASGTCVLTAVRAGDNNYNASAESAPFTVTLNKANQTTAVLLTAPSAVTFGTTGTAAASGGDGTGAYSFNAGASTGCSVSGTTVSVSNASGTCALTAIRGSDNNYYASSSSAVFPVTLNKATQTALSLTVPASITFGTTGTATTLGGSGNGALTFSATGSTGCAVNAGTGVISVSDASGTCSISASKAGDNNYNGPVSDGPKSVTLVKAGQTISWAAPAPITYGTNLAGVLNATVTTGNGALSYNEAATPLTTTTVLNAGTHTLTAVAAPTNNYNTASTTVSLTVNPAAATITLNNLVQPLNNIQSPTASATPVGSNTPVSVTFVFTYTVNGSPTLTKPTQVGVYALDVDIAAGANYTGHADGYFVVYDPAGGFVTGGGWIDSPAGAYAADPTLAGKANFGFNSKYQKGATVPTGNTEFQFQEGNLNFKSTNFQWLVIQGSTKAQFKGTGTINGTGTYNFIVTAIDGDAFNGTKKPDAFRIKITDLIGNTVYDNQIGKDETGDFATTLGGGSIVIHDK